jgi:hypothetical protein
MITEGTNASARLAADGYRHAATFAAAGIAVDYVDYDEGN